VYQGFYQFSRDPFAAPSDARQIFMAAAHRDAISTVVRNVLKCQPFIAVVGDGEVGKTTVLNAALASLTDQRRRNPVQVTRVDHGSLPCLNAHRIIGQMLGQQASGRTDEDLERLIFTLRKDRDDGSQHVLVIDDAPLVTPGAGQLLTLFSGLQTEGIPWLQVVLAGRHDFWQTLASDEWCPHDNPAAGRSAVEALADHEVRQYIDYRLKLAGRSIDQVMTDTALSDIVHHGKSLPGRINRILDRAFTLGAAQGRSRVTPHVVDEAITVLQDAGLLPAVPAAVRPPPSFVRSSGQIPRNPAEARSHTAQTSGYDQRKWAGWWPAWLAGVTAVVILGFGLTVPISLPTPNPGLVTAAAPTDATIRPAAGTEAMARHAASAETVSHPVARAPDENAPNQAPAKDLALSARTFQTVPPVARLEPPTSAPPPVAPADSATRPTDGPTPAAERAAAGASGSLPTAPPLSCDTPSNLLGCGATALAAGDITAARALYERAFAAGNGQAAIAIGTTYDPAFLAKRRATGIQADSLVATIWYRRGMALGGNPAPDPAVE
jgi:general secretion pathway protein A